MERHGLDGTTCEAGWNDMEGGLENHPRKSYQHLLKKTSAAFSKFLHLIILMFYLCTRKTALLGMV